MSSDPLKIFNPNANISLSSQIDLLIEAADDVDRSIAQASTQTDGKIIKKSLVHIFDASVQYTKQARLMLAQASEILENQTEDLIEFTLAGFVSESFPATIEAQEKGQKIMIQKAPELAQRL